MKKETWKDKILKFNEELESVHIELPENYYLNNPFNGQNKEKIKEITTIFYEKYYNDTNERYLILGSSPARKGTSVTGVPFESMNHIYALTGINIDNFYINKSSSDFLYQVMEEYGGYEKFYHNFYMSFVCPLGIVKKTEKNSFVNSNYYENKKLEQALSEFILSTLKKQLSFGINPSVCFVIGSGENFKYLVELNKEYKFFKKIIPLEHPRFIMQYNRKDKEKYLKKYLDALTNEVK